MFLLADAVGLSGRVGYGVTLATTWHYGSEVTVAAISHWLYIIAWPRCRFANQSWARTPMPRSLLVVEGEREDHLWTGR